MDEFLILLQAKLNEAKSKENVNGDIDKIQSQLDKLKIQAELDPKAAQKLADSIGKLINQKIVISNIGIDGKSATKAGQEYGKQFSQGVSQELKSNSLKLDTFKKSLANIGMGSKEIDAVANRISNLGVQIETLNQARSSGKKDILSVNIAGIDEYGQAIKLTQQYNIATGELVNAIDAVSTAQQNIGNNTNSIKKAENVFADYTAKIEQFKSTNSNILSGLLDPLSDFESKLSGLKNGTASIDDVINSYKNLNAEASKITSNLSAQFNKVDSAVRNITKGDEVIASLRADFKGLSNAPKEVNSELTKCEKLLLNVKNIERQEGRTVNWSAAYKEWEQSLDSLKAKIATLKKEQLNVASSQIFNTKDLDSQGKIYIQKVNNTIEKTKAELESKLRNAGYMDIQIKGTEDASGKIKSLTATVTDATGAFKQLNFERAKIQNNGKAQAGFVQTDDVKVIGNISSSIGKVQNNLSSLKTEWEEQGVLVGEFKTKVEQLDSSLSSIGSKGELNGIKTQIQELKNEASTILKVNEIQLSMDNGHGASKYQNRIQSLINDFQKYGIAAETAKTQTESLQQILDNMKGMSGQELVAQANKFEQEFKAVKISVDEAKLSYDKLLQPISSTQQINLTNKIEKWLVNNTRATSKARSELQLYLKELESGQVTNGRYTEISNAFTTIDTQMRSMDKLGKSLFQSLSDGAKKFTSWISATAIVMRAITTVRTGIKVVKELDTALVDLKKTANMSARELIGFYHSANDTAKQMGVTTKEIIEQAAAWSRLGFSTADAATKMAKYSSMFATISPGMNLDSATDGLVSVMKAFKIGLENTDEVVDGIMSKINIIGNTQAVNNSDIVDFLRRSSSAMAEANNTLEDTIALGTAMVEITRDAAGAGQVLKTVSMRVRGYDEETEEFIGGVEELSGKIADLTKTASTPGGISLFTDDAKTEFKSTRQLLQEISEIYDQLNDKTQAELLEALAGKRNGQAVSAILNNFDTVTQSLESMSNSAGNAEAEMAIAMDSIDYKLNRVKETGTGIAQNLFGQEDMKLILDAIGSIGNGIDWLTNKLNLFGTIGVGGLGIGITQFVKSFD